MRDNSLMPLDGAHPVLIVEDSENTATMLEITLAGIPGVAVQLATNPVEALRILNDGGPAVHAVVTDLNMPRMDGFEFIRRIRADEKLSEMPIMVVSADTDPATPQRIAQLRVNAFFPKPFSPAQVRRRMEQLLDGAV
jgi:two-component system, chemotaxis family, chemotaxis protein CheY